MIDIRLDEKKLRKRLAKRAIEATAESLDESEVMRLIEDRTVSGRSKFREEITNEGVARVFEKAIEHAIVARALLEIINAQMTDENEVIFDRIVEEVAEQVATFHASTHDKIIASSTPPKVQA